MRWDELRAWWAIAAPDPWALYRDPDLRGWVRRVAVRAGADPWAVFGLGEDEARWSWGVAREACRDSAEGLASCRTWFRERFPLPPPRPR